MRLTAFCLLVCSVLTVAKSAAQESIMGQLDYQYMEKLVQLAKENYPRNQISKIQEASYKAAVSAAKVSYLDIINVSYFFRPEDRAALNPDNPFVFNGFQFGVYLSPGILFQKPAQVKQAKAEYQISKLQTKEAEIILENQVKSRYYDYVLALSEVKAKAEDAQTAKVLFDDLRLKFERGEVELEMYSTAKRTYTQSASALIQAEVSLLKAKDLLEELIGVTLDEVK